MSQTVISEEVAEILKLFRETDTRLDQRIRETDTRLDQRLKETDAVIRETSKEVKAASANLRRLEGLFTSQWGRMLEALVQPGVLKLFQARGHQVQRLHQRSKAHYKGDTMEIDLILEDSIEVIVLENKSRLGVEEVDETLADLVRFPDFFPLYKGYHIYGAVAGLEVPDSVARYAYRRGLYVLSITGDDLVSIRNDERFRPRDFTKRAEQADEI